MIKQIKPRYILTGDDPYFGTCPDCHYEQAVKDYPTMNAGKSHWNYCDEHRNAWYTGYGVCTGKPEDYTEDGIVKTLKILEDNYTRIEGVTTLESKENKLAMMQAVKDVIVQWCITVGDNTMAIDRRASLDPMLENMQIRFGNNGNAFDNKQQAELLRRIADVLESRTNKNTLISEAYLINTVLPEIDYGLPFDGDNLPF